MLKITLLTIWLAAVAPVVSGQDRYEFPWHNVEVVIRGDLFRAATVAYEDFSKRLAERVARLPGESNDRPAQYVAVIDNYDVKVGFGPGKYVVWITPRSTPEFPGDVEAGAFYTIDAKTFTVREKVY
jgi:hypothetical protein